VRRALDGYNFNEIASALYQFTWHSFCDWYVEWIKKDLYGDDDTARETARGVLLCVLENILKLMHPVTPFVTEEIWSQLPGERDTIMLAPFPEENPAWQDERAEADMDLLMDVISGLRTIRTEAELHPTAKIRATIIAPDGDKRALLERFAPSISTMVRAEALDIVETAQVPDDAGHALVGDVELVVPLAGLIDVEAELEKLARERSKIEKELKRVRGKLGNEKFLANAPAAVVDKERAKEEELAARLAKNEESVARLRKLT